MLNKMQSSRESRGVAWGRDHGDLWGRFAMSTAYHMVNYRLFKPAASGSATLEAMCRSVLGKPDATGQTLWNRARDRIYVSDDGPRIMLNRVADLSTAVFGEMCLVQEGGLQALLEFTAANVQLSNITTAQIFNLQERSAPVGSQFVRGMIYWFSIANHLFFVRTQGMTAEHLRAYLNWLLVAGGALPTTSPLTLQAEFDRAQVGDDVGEIKSVRVSGRASTLSVAHFGGGQATPRQVGTMRRVADRVVEFAQAVPIVEALIGKPKAQSLVESLAPDEYLTVDASVKVRGRRSVESRARMKELANELADLTDGKVLVEGKDGKVTDDDAILRTRMPFELPHEGSNLLDFDNVADQLQEVYIRFVKDGKIAAK
jgi:hypothetical protein